MKTKIGHVTFEHHDEYRGDVEIRKGEAMVKVPIDALRTFVAEHVRLERIERIRKMKPADLLNIAD